MEYFLRLCGLWEGILSLPPPPVSIHRGWSDPTYPPPKDWCQDTPAEWEAPGLPLDDGYTLVLDGGDPHEIADFPTSSVG